MIQSYIIDKSPNGGYEFRNVMLAARPLVGETVRFTYEGVSHRYTVSKITHVSDRDRAFLSIEALPEHD